MKAKPSTKILSWMLACILITGLFPVSAFAESTAFSVDASNAIIAFESLSEAADVREVPLGTSIDDLNLPATLTATVSLITANDPAAQRQNASPEKTVSVPAKWASVPEYDGDTPGTYIFTAEVEGYEVCASPPIAVVMVLPGDGGAKRLALRGAAEPWEGAGTIDDPYRISDRADLEALAVSVNGGNLCLRKFFVLTDDIDLAGSDWTPIGNELAPFAGSFDGDGFMIKNMSVRQSGNGYAGLFGYIAYASTYGYSGYGNEIRNLGVSGRVEVANRKNAFAGGIAAYSKAGITKCYSSCTISIRNVDWFYAGGIAGYFNPASWDITHCYNTGTIDVTGVALTGAAGGIAGMFNYAQNQPRVIEKCYNVGRITAVYENGDPIPVGGVVGKYIGSYTGAKDTFYLITSTPYNIDMRAIPCTREYLQSSEFLRILKKAGVPWKIESGKNDGYPFLTGRPAVFRITATAGPDGSISPNYGADVSEGSDMTFSIKAGYHNANVCWIASVVVDGLPVSDVRGKREYTYVFSNISSDHTIEVTFFYDNFLENEFTIDPIPPQTPTGQPVTPDVTVTDRGSTLVNETDYTVRYVNNINPGMATATVIGKGRYAVVGARTVNFLIAEEFCKVTFDANGGDGTMAEQIFGKGMPQQLTANEFTCEEMNFVGWNTEKDGSGTNYANRAEIAPVIDLCLYAQWKVSETVTVTFDKNGGDTEARPKTRTVVRGKFTELPAPPTKNGVFFRGWNTAADGTGVNFTAATAVTGDITVYAQWGEALQVTFDSNGGDTAPNPSVQRTGYGETVAMPTTPTKANTVFRGWNTAADGTGVNFTAATAVTGDITVYAQWGEALQVTFDENGGDTAPNPSVQSTGYDETAMLPATPPTRQGYTFMGWNTKADGSGTQFTASTRVTGDITVYAQWLSPLTAGDGSQNNPYLIGTAEELRAMSYYVGTDNQNYGGKYYLLTRDIDLGARWTIDADGNATLISGKAWTPIADFYGSGQQCFFGNFDGDNHTISGLYLNSGANYQGLFGGVRSAVVENVGLVDSYIRGTYSIGGIVGTVIFRADDPNGRVSTIHNCYNKSTIIGHSFVGGIAGEISGRMVNIVDCYNEGEITAAIGGVGGLAGDAMSDVQIRNCYNTGTIIDNGSTGSSCAAGLLGSFAGTAAACYDAGSIEGPAANVNYWRGALIGNLDRSASLEGCYYLEGTAPAGIARMNTTEANIYEALPASREEMTSGKLAHLLQAQNSDFKWGHTTLDGSEFPRLAASDSNVKKVVRVRFYDDAAVPGTFTLLQTAYTLSGNTAAFPALPGTTWRDKNNTVYDSGTALSADVDLYTDVPPANVLTGTAVIDNPNPRIGDVLTGSLTDGDYKGRLTYTWKAGGVAVGTDAITYIVTEADLGKQITLEITSDTETGTVKSAATAAAGKKVPQAPPAPTLSGKTHNSVTLSANAAYQFSKDSTTWQTNNIFTGLSPSTTYSFYQRVAATAFAEASPASPKLEVTTDNAAGTDATISPASASYDLAAPADISTTIAWNSAKMVTDVAYGADSLVLSADYAVHGTQLAINSSYLAAKNFNAGDTADFTISFDKGNSAILTVSIVNNYTPGSDADLSDLTVGGSTVSGFRADQLSYDVELPSGTSPNSADATVGATAADAKAGVRITQVSSFPGSAIVVVTAEDGNTTKTYTVNLTLEAAPPVQSAEKDVISVTDPAGAVISGTDITATVENSVASQTIDLSVSAKASWRLYGEASCTNEIANKIMTLSVGPNTAYVRVTAEDGSTRDYTLTITRQDSAPGVSVVGVSLNKGSIALYSNTIPKTETLVAAVSPDNAANKAVSWASSDSSVATVDASGKVTAIGDGKATITVTTEDGGFTASCTVTVTTYTSGGNTGGGGSGGGGSAVLMPAPSPIVTEKQPNMPTTAKISVSGSVKDGILSANITGRMVKDAIEAAQDAARKSGKEADGIALNFGVTGAGSYTGLSVTLDAGAIDLLKEAGVKSVKIGSTVLDITVDAEAIAEIDKQSDGTVTVSAKPLARLSDAAKLTGNRPVFDITVSYRKNGKTEIVSNFGKGMVTSGIDYKFPTPAFTDTDTHWAKDSIDFVASRGLISGTTETTFSPNAAITRADFLMALGRLSGADVSIYGQSSFADVNAADTAMPYIEWAVKSKIVSGYGSGEFGPKDPITREQMSVMMQNYAKATGYELPTSAAPVIFSDNTKISAYAREAVKVIQQAGIIRGRGSNTFDPQAGATRGEACTILRRLVEL